MTESLIVLQADDLHTFEISEPDARISQTLREAIQGGLRTIPCSGLTNTALQWAVEFMKRCRGQEWETQDSEPLEPCELAFVQELQKEKVWSDVYQASLSLRIPFLQRIMDRARGQGMAIGAST